MNIKPRKNRVLLKYIEQGKITKGGIALPENIQKKATEDIFGFINQGEIIAIGPDVETKDIKIGDRVIFKKTEALHVKVSGTETKDGKEEKYLLIEDRFITCKITK